MSVASPWLSSVPGASNSPALVYAYLLRLSSSPYLVCADARAQTACGRRSLGLSLRLGLSLGLGLTRRVGLCVSGGKM